MDKQRERADEILALLSERIKGINQLKELFVYDRSGLGDVPVAYWKNAFDRLEDQIFFLLLYRARLKFHSPGLKYSLLDGPETFVTVEDVDRILSDVKDLYMIVKRDREYKFPTLNEQIDDFVKDISNQREYYDWFEIFSGDFIRMMQDSNETDTPNEIKDIAAEVLTTEALATLARETLETGSIEDAKERISDAIQGKKINWLDTKTSLAKILVFCEHKGFIAGGGQLNKLVEEHFVVKGQPISNFRDIKSKSKNDPTYKGNSALEELDQILEDDSTDLPF